MGVFYCKMRELLANGADPGETACYEPAHQDLHCLCTPVKRSLALKGLIASLYN